MKVSPPHFVRLIDYLSLVAKKGSKETTGDFRFLKNSIVKRHHAQRKRLRLNVFALKVALTFRSSGISRAGEDIGKKCTQGGIGRKVPVDKLV